MELYPVTFEADYVRERNRLTTFFRPIVAIPWLVVAYVYAIAAGVVITISWFALLILGRYPRGMYDFVGGVLRYSMRVNAFAYLQTDAWPPFGISDDPAYPVRVNYAAPAERQSRVKTLFRIFLVLPLLILSYGVAFVQAGASLVAWMTIVFRGYQPAAIHNALAWINGWSTRVNAYFYLMRDEYPPVGDEVLVEVDPPATALEPGTEAAGLDAGAGQEHGALSEPEGESPQSQQ